MLVFFFFNDTATTEIYTLSLHDALPISLALGREVLDAILVDRVRALGVELRERTRVTDVLVDDGHVVGVEAMDADTRVQDRKSTRLNSSHSQISYAVFCLKKKNIHTLLRLRRSAANAILLRHSWRLPLRLLPTALARM